MFGKGWGGGCRLDFSIYVFQFEFVVCFQGDVPVDEFGLPQIPQSAKWSSPTCLCVTCTLIPPLCSLIHFWHLSLCVCVSLPPQSLFFLLSLSFSSSSSLFPPPPLSVSLTSSLSLVLVFVCPQDSNQGEKKASASETERLLVTVKFSFFIYGMGLDSLWDGKVFSGSNL